MQFLQSTALLLVTLCTISFYPTELLLAKSPKLALEHQPPVLREREYSDSYSIDEQETEFPSSYSMRAKRMRSSNMRHAVRAGAKIGAIIGAVLAIIGVIARVIPFLTIPVMPIQIPLFILSAALVIGISSAIHAAQGAVIGAVIMHSTNKSIEKEERLLFTQD